jgi:hypothetical protein
MMVPGRGLTGETRASTGGLTSSWSAPARSSRLPVQRPAQPRCPAVPLLVPLLRPDTGALPEQKKHPYKMREVMSLRSMARGTGLTVGGASIALYALVVSVQLRRKVSALAGRASQTWRADFPCSHTLLR